MTANQSHDHPIVRTINGMFEPSIKEVDSTVVGTVTTYEGWAGTKGADVADPLWKIKKTVAVTVGSIVTTTVTYPDANEGFEFIWTNRAALQYSSV